jgi:HK97 family phage prohead protease
MEYTKYFDFAVKEIGDGDPAGQFTGYASTFGNRDLQSDIVMPGAFARTLKSSKGKVPILMGHLMARIVGFGIHAEEDEHGLKVTGEFTLDSDEGRNAYAMMKHAAKVGHKPGLSIGYGIAKDGAEYDEARGIRRLTDVDLYEYSIAAVPANPRARVGAVKAADSWTARDFEEYLREAGLSREAAKRFVLRGFSAFDQRDADGGDHISADAAFSAELRELRDYITLTGV